MEITIRVFAAMRERAGIGERTFDLPDGTTVADAIQAAAREAGEGWLLPSRLMTAVNGEYAEGDAVLRDGDELALIPPVSGGAETATPGPLADVAISTEPLDPAPLLERVRSDRDGAVVTFLGVTRDHNDGRRVLHLEYEAYQPMAEQVMTEIIGEMKARWPIGEVAVAHRVGRVDVGETSMVLAVSAAHREPAFEAALYFVDRLKEVVPIWKKEYFEGGEVWIGDDRG